MMDLVGNEGGSQSGDSTIKRVMRLIDNIRQYGHLKANIYPVNPPERKNIPKLEINRTFISFFHTNNSFICIIVNISKMF
jgi:2-oxoglutarate dehydrogenase complex dehydrogenase (E1) component-like enzyme